MIELGLFFSLCVLALVIVLMGEFAKVKDVNLDGEIEMRGEWGLEL